MASHIRDERKDFEYFNKFIKEENEMVEDFTTEITRSKNIESGKLKRLLDRIAYSNLSLLIAKYSIGKDITEIKKQFLLALESIERSWGKTSDDFRFSNYPEPYFSTDDYWEILILLSLGYLLEIDNNNFERIVKMRDIINEGDKLLDFIINAKKGGRASSNTMQGCPYGELLKILDIDSSQKEKAINYLKEYLSKQWYKENKSLYWYNNHKNALDTYFGYWSFESGALVQILGLDDSKLKDQQYYPYHMVASQAIG